MSKNIQILNVRFDALTLEQALKQAMNFAKSHKQHYICTPNPEILLEARRNARFLQVLNNSSLNIADGIGTVWAANYLTKTSHYISKVRKFLSWKWHLLKILTSPHSLKKPLPERVTGTDLMEAICKECSKFLTINKPKIFLLGADEGIAVEAKLKLQTKYPRLKIVGTYSGSPKDKEAVKIINSKFPNILFVAFGAPAQELWIANNLKKMPSVHLAIGVGGAFNFFAGTRKRAPDFMRKLGLEWLFRLIQEPTRFQRIYNAVVKFPIRILKENLK
ncbi:MAG: WecB/TagA/CpsF family glycosyltransferase [Candidatus Gracilibacteria bacterium]